MGDRFRGPEVCEGEVRLRRSKLGRAKVVLVLAILWAGGSAGVVPVTGASLILAPGYLESNPHVKLAESVPSLPDFRKTLPSNGSDRIVGVYVTGKLALRVLEQPVNQPGYVTPQADAVSQFRLAQGYGTVGLLAHNTLAGGVFSRLVPGDQVVLLSGNGGERLFTIQGIRRLQALSPWSQTSVFREVGPQAAILSTRTVFSQVYGGGYPLVFQTCIAEGGNPSWGRLFVLAAPLPTTRENAMARRLLNEVAEAD